MKLSLIACALLLAVVAIECSPVSKRDVDDLSPLNESEDDDRSDRDKRKIGIVKLGVSNGILNFIFGKLDGFLDAKTKALTVLDQGNKVKNAAFEIDNTKSATSEFIAKFIQQKVKATTGSIGPVLNAGTTFLSSAAQGVAGAFASKFAPLSSLSGGLTGGLSGGAGGQAGAAAPASGGSDSGSFITGILGSLSGSSGGNGGASGGLASLSSLSSGLSGSSGNGAGSSAGNGVDDAAGADYPSAFTDANASGGFANLNGGIRRTTRKPRTTTEDIPEFDRTKVSLDVPPQLIGGGFDIITAITKVISSLIMNSARRTESVLEVFKPIFRGAFAIKGLPSDNPK